MRPAIATFFLLIFTAPALAGEAVGRLELGEAAGEPGEVVEVPLLFSGSHPLCAFAVIFEPRPLEVELLGYEVESAAAVDPASVVGESLHEGGVFGVLFCEPGDHLAPAGEGVPLGRLRLRIDARAPAGDVALEPARRLFGTNLVTQFSFEVDGSAVTLPVEVIGGRVTVLPPSGPRPLEDLACEQFLDRAELEFRGVTTYDAIEVHRDGELIATLPGDARSYGEALPRLGPLGYWVVGRRDGKGSVPAICELVAVPPAAPPAKDLRCAEGGSPGGTGRPTSASASSATGARSPSSRARRRASPTPRRPRDRRSTAWSVSSRAFRAPRRRASPAASGPWRRVMCRCRSTPSGSWCRSS